jgi:predicted enzyme related to lactoylglutathione lyase
VTMPEMRLELVPLPVADVDRAKAFYERAGFDLGVGSACTIVFGTGMPGISDMRPGSVHGLHLVVNDITEARQALVDRGVEVEEVMDVSQVKYAAFHDPDGNTWLLQEFPANLRQPGQSFYSDPQ